MPDRSYPLVYLEWQDAVANTEWFTEKQCLEWAKTAAFVVWEVGWVIDENENHIVLASRHSPQDDSYKALWGSVQYIPRTWIMRRVDLTDAVRQNEEKDEGGEAMK